MGPQIGDRIEQAIMGADTDITVEDVPDHQPHADLGIYVIVDQYGERHYVEQDAETWVTVNSALTPLYEGEIRA
jgi:hypothetical protein